MLQKRINNWLTHFKQYFFKYKKGCYELSYIANSPQSTIESFKKMPFVKHHKKHQTFIMKTVFSSGFYKYYQLEEGFWLSVSEVDYHKNVMFKLLYDEFIDDKYYTLTLNFINNNEAKISNLINNAMPLSDLSWILLKPRANLTDVNFKGSNCKYIIFYFTEEWLVNQMKQGGLLFKSNLMAFVKSTKDSVLFIDNNKQLFGIYEQFNALFENEIKPNDSVIKNSFNQLTRAFFNLFLGQYSAHYAYDDAKILNNADRNKIREIENILMKNLLGEFAGIEALANQFFISPTKLKADFKKLYGVSIYQYYLSKQMILAHQLISEKNMMVKDVAALLHYENTSKFILAYKKHFGYLPSENFR